MKHKNGLITALLLCAALGVLSLFTGASDPDLVSRAALVQHYRELAQYNRGTAYIMRDVPAMHSYLTIRAQTYDDVATDLELFR